MRRSSCSCWHWLSARWRGWIAASPDGSRGGASWASGSLWSRSSRRPVGPRLGPVELAAFPRVRGHPAARPGGTPRARFRLGERRRSNGACVRARARRHAVGSGTARPRRAGMEVAPPRRALRLLLDPAPRRLLLVPALHAFVPQDGSPPDWFHVPFVLTGISLIGLQVAAFIKDGEQAERSGGAGVRRHLCQLSSPALLWRTGLPAASQACMPPSSCATSV